jgi:SPP1 gp7 family putative phage head morphogenesis protein
MRQLLLKPIQENPEDFEKVAKEIQDLVRKEIFLPIILEIGLKSKVLNSSEDLLRAIQSGQITYHKGKFKGKFDSTLSRELRGIGAEWDKKQGAWLIPQSKLSIEIRNAISLSNTKFEQLLSRINEKVKSLDAEKIAGKINIDNIFDTTLSKIEKNFKKIVVAPDVSLETVKRLHSEYKTNLVRSIKKMTEEEIEKIRHISEENVFFGHKSEELLSQIQKTYKMSQNRAKFIARQETKLMTVKYKEIRFESAGITEYIWKTVGGTIDHKVRDSHAVLNNTKQKFSSPPNTANKGEAPRFCNPGEDFNCRCLAIPIVTFK